MVEPGPDFNLKILTCGIFTPGRREPQESRRAFSLPRMDTDEPDSARAATTDFGLRRESRSAEPRRFWAQPTVRKAVSPLRSATAVKSLFVRAEVAGLYYG